MVVKKRKNGAKKSVLTVVKKVVGAKKTAKPAKKTAKKAAPKKPQQKVVKKVEKKVAAVPAKKIVKKMAKPPVKKITKKPPQKVVAKKVTPEKKSSVKNAAPSLKLKTKPNQSTKKMTEKMDHDAMVMPVETQRPKKATTLLGALEFTPYQPKPDEEYMGDHQRDHFRKILDAWKQQLMQDVDLTVGHLKEDAVFYADPVDRASQEEGFNLELRTRDRERKLIKKIEQSLDLLNIGEYGFCEDCGAEIGIRRLEARPTAIKCIDCKTFQEIREKQLGG